MLERRLRIIAARNVTIAPDMILRPGTYVGKGLKTPIGIEYILELIDRIPMPDDRPWSFP
jgi:hypothetical protein